jgi:ubiquinone/menaquinone biosynthesis C-methylase UbiE/uncharacterized protein YbaR (Trm112 family)
MNSLKDRIYEKLSTQPEPPGYSGLIPWIVQQQVAATNGIHYVNSIGTLNEYPIPELPIGAGQKDNLLLDIGCGWGRWLTAASRKNYIPVGIDLRLEFCETARKVVQDNGANTYTVVADLQELPFQNNIFEVVWSFSVIQHTHYNRLISCLEQIERILKSNGYCFLEFPNKKGLRNRFGPATGPNNMDFDSWDVRYYSPEEYKIIFNKYFDNFEFYNHSALGIGILPGDLKYAKGFKNKAIIGLSRSLSRIVDMIGPLKEFADSIYIKSVKTNREDGKSFKTNMEDGQSPEAVKNFLAAHHADPENNLNIVPLLRCPRSGTALYLSDDRNELISREAGLAYPVVNQIPIMVSSESRSI